MSKQYELYEIMEYIKNIPHTDSPTSYQSKTLLELNNNVSNDLIQELFNSIMNNEITLLEVSQLPSIEPHTITRLLTSKSAYFKKEIKIKKFVQGLGLIDIINTIYDQRYTFNQKFTINNSTLYSYFGYSSILNTVNSTYNYRTFLVDFIASAEIAAILNEIKLEINKFQDPFKSTMLNYYETLSHTLFYATTLAEYTLPLNSILNWATRRILDLQFVTFESITYVMTQIEESLINDELTSGMTNEQLLIHFKTVTLPALIDNINYHNKDVGVKMINSALSEIIFKNLLSELTKTGETRDPIVVSNEFVALQQIERKTLLILNALKTKLGEFYG